jgi:hypothetical protein
VYDNAMSKKKFSGTPQQAYVLRVNIADSKPKIWRNLSVPENCTLGDLHIVLQAAFDWDNSHMHSFTINSVRYGMAETECMDFGDKFDEIDENTVCLCQLDLQPKQKFRYLYDFGDSWEHEITVSKIVPIAAEDGGPMWPYCLGGERAGPLENSGGIWGYEEMLDILKDPKHANYKDMYEWAGDFDPEYISIEKINTRLEKIFKRGFEKAKK